MRPDRTGPVPDDWVGASSADPAASANPRRGRGAGGLSGADVQPVGWPVARVTEPYGVVVGGRASWRPSGETTTPFPVSVWPSRVAVVWPPGPRAARCQRGRRWRPRLERAAVHAGGVAVVWPVAASNSRTVPIVARARQRAPVRRERHPQYRAGVASKRRGQPASGRVQQPHGPIAAGARQRARVRGECDPQHRAGVGGERGGQPASGRVPQPHRRIAAGARQRARVRGERHPQYRAGVAGKRRG